MAAATGGGGPPRGGSLVFLAQGRSAMKRSIAMGVGICLVALAGLSFQDRRGREADAAGPVTEAPRAGAVLTVGSISRTQKEEVATFQPFADYLAGRLKAAGIARGRVLVATSMREMADLMKKREVDIFIDSPFPIAVVGELSGARPFLRRWKKGMVEYHSVIFVRRESGIETVQDLKGKMVAFDERFSTSGYLLPKATLKKAGLTLTEYANPAAKVSSNHVGYVFTNDEENTMFWVLRKRVAAGVLSDGDFTELAKERIGELKVLLRTVTVPRHVVSHRADLSPGLLAAVEDVLVNMDRDAEGRQALARFQKTTKFDRFPQGAEAAFQPIRELVRLIETDLGE